MNRQSIIEKIRTNRDEIRQLFTDAEHWNQNVRKPDESEIDPDPDGLMRKIEQGYTETLDREDARQDGAKIEAVAPREKHPWYPKNSFQRFPKPVCGTLCVICKGFAIEVEEDRERPCPVCYPGRTEPVLDSENATAQGLRGSVTPSETPKDTQNENDQTPSSQSFAAPCSAGFASCRICTHLGECRTADKCLYPNSGAPPPADVSTIRSGEFRWHAGRLEQKTSEIQHRKTVREIGVYTVWESVKCDGQFIQQNAGSLQHGTPERSEA